MCNRLIRILFTYDPTQITGDLFTNIWLSLNNCESSSFRSTCCLSCKPTCWSSTDWNRKWYRAKSSKGHVGAHTHTHTEHREVYRILLYACVYMSVFPFVLPVTSQLSNKSYTICNDITLKMFDNTKNESKVEYMSRNYLLKYTNWQYELSD